MSNITNIRKDYFHCHSIQNKRYVSEPTCFLVQVKAPVFVLNIVTMEEVFLNVCDIIYGLFQLCRCI
jgi:hypothetical protein